MIETPSQELLKRLLSYDPESGSLTWKKREWVDDRGRPRAFRFGGKEAGCRRSDGKIVVQVGGALCLAHRIIWKLVHGVEPECVDHINGDCSDNRLSNLRNVTQAENNRNVARRSDNTSGHAGVRYRNDRGNWAAVLAGRWIGSFATKDEAVAARREAQKANGFTRRHGQ